MEREKFSHKTRRIGDLVDIMASGVEFEHFH